MKRVKWVIVFVLISMGGMPSLLGAWPSEAKRQAIRQFLAYQPDRLLKWNSRVGEWSVDKMKRYYDSLVEDGFPDPRTTIQRNPPLLSMSIERRRESIRYLTDVWKIPMQRIIKEPRLIGHYLPAAQDYLTGLDPSQIESLMGLRYIQRVAILMAIRAVDFKTPRWVLGAAVARTQKLHCTHWVSELTQARRKEIFSRH